MIEQKVAFVLEYEGTEFHGWQIQKGHVTIQGLLESALTTLYRRPISVVGASRTDAGVHARCQVAHARLDGSLPRARILRGLNALLPSAVSVVDLFEVPEKFHARFDARRKIYCYRIWNNAVPHPFVHRFTYHFHDELNDRTMDDASRHLIGTHDFQSFRAASCGAQTTVRTLLDCRIDRIGSLIRITVSGNGFLQHMVRIISGTLIEVGLGRRLPEEMSSLLDQMDRTKAGFTAPARGLTLEQIDYDCFSGKILVRDLVW